MDETRKDYKKIKPTEKDKDAYRKQTGLELENIYIQDTDAWERDMAKIYDPEVVYKDKEEN